MASDVTMPRLSDSMEEGTVLKWLVDEGGEVKRGEPLVEIETDKANMTYDADSDGVLVEIVAQEGDTLPIGEVIARIGEAGEAKSGGGDEESSGDEAEADAGEPRPSGDERPTRAATRREEADGGGRAGAGRGRSGGRRRGRALKPRARTRRRPRATPTRLPPATRRARPLLPAPRVAAVRRRLRPGRLRASGRRVATATGASRPRRLRGAWRATSAWSSLSSRAPGRVAGS